MTPIVGALLALVASFFHSCLPIQLEILALRHQLTLSITSRAGDRTCGPAIGSCGHGCPETGLTGGEF